jgi:hypothetical protein
MPFTGRSATLEYRYGVSGDLEDQASDLGQITQIERHMLLCLKYGAGAALVGTYDADFEVTIGSGLSVVVAAGTGLISGLVISKATSTTKSGLSDNSTVYLYLKKTSTTRDDGSFTVEQSLSGAGMTDAILIASCVTSGGVVTSVDNDPAGRTPHIPFVASGLPGLKTVGASGCDYTDPRTAIQAASAGDTILITPGTYAVTAAITVPANNVSIIGMSREAVVLSFTTADATHCLTISSRTGTRVAHLTISAVASKTGDGIRGTTISDVLIEDVKVLGPNLNRGIYATAGARVHIVRCYLSGAFGEAAINMATVTEALVVDSEIVNSYAGVSYGLILQSSSHRSRVMDNLFTMSGAGATRCVSILDSDSVKFYANRIEASSPATSGASWLYIKAAARSCQRIRCLGNAVIAATDYGTGIYATYTGSYTLDACQFNDNIFVDCAQAINLTGANITETRVHDNFFSSCAAGLADSGTSTNAVDNT